MDIKWKKNAHILIKSDSGYLKIDHQENIRRVSSLGRLWFIIKDLCTGGKETVRLNKAIEKTLEAVRNELSKVKDELTLALNDLPLSKDILNFNEFDSPLSIEIKRTVFKVKAIVKKLILRGNLKFHLLMIPDYSCRTECLRDLPQAISLHSQANRQVKTHPALRKINKFFNLSFIQNEIKKEFVLKEIVKNDRDWVG